MAQILVARDAEEAAATMGKAGCQLKIGEVGAAVRVEPVLLLGEVVVRHPGPVKLAQSRLGGTKIADIALGLRDMQRHACDPAAHQHAAFGKKQARPHIEPAGLRQRAALAPE